MRRVAPTILYAIGRTPLVQPTRVVPAGAADVLVGLESTNLTDSYKDRVALARFEGAASAEEQTTT